MRVVRVVTGVARGARLELDLANEKAYWLGHYEPEVQDYLRKHLAPGDVVYDIGAHHGFLSVCAARLGARVYAFEPVADNARRIRRQAELNGLSIEVVEAAVWDSSAGIELVRSDSSSEWHAEEGGGFPSLTLDEFAAEAPPPTLIKIDVEGAEGRVLRGAVALLERQAPTVLCEIHGDATRSEVFALLAAYEIETVGAPERIGASPRGRTIDT